MKKHLIFLFILALVVSVFFACNSKEIPVVKFELEVQVEGEGTVSPSSGSYEVGTTIKFDLVPNTGWQFSTWAGENLSDVRETDGNWKILMNGNKKLTAIFVELGKAKEYILSVTVNGYGKVEPNSGKYEEGSIVVFDIEAETGWSFKEWSGKDGGDVKEVQGNWQVTMDSSKNIIADFVINEYSLTINTEGEGSVNVSERMEPCNLYPHNTELTLIAQAKEGWAFKEWRGDLQSEKATETLLMDSDKEVTAVFVKMNFNLDIEIIGEGQVVQSIAKESEAEYPYGTLVKLEAIPASGWAFKAWSGDLSGGEPLAEILLDDHKKVTASFIELVYYELKVDIQGQGMVNQNPLAGKYQEGTLVTLTASPAENWFFKGWSGSVNDSSFQIEVLMDSNKAIQAIFEKMTYALNIDVQGQGRVEEEVITTSEYPYQTKIRLTAKADYGWQFFAWQGDASGSQEIVEIEMDSDKFVEAVFAALPVYNLDIAIDGQGTVVCKPEQTEFFAGESVNLLAEAAKGWLFTEWSGDLLSGEASLTLIMDSPKSLTVHFVRKNYNLTVNQVGQGRVEEKIIRAASNDYPFETLIELRAIADSGWRFKEWQGDASGHEPITEILMVEDKAVTAVFEIIPLYSIKVNIAEGGTFALTPKQEKYEDGTEVILEAMAYEGWMLQSWSSDLGDANSDGTFTILMDADKEFTLVFARKNYEITVTVKGQGEVTDQEGAPIVQGEYPFETVLELNARPASWWEFIGWQGDYVGTSPKVELTIINNMHVEAVFALQKFTLTVKELIGGRILDEEGKELVSQEYDYGTSLVLRAQAASGWEFVEWEGAVQGTELTTSITMDGDKEISATFSEIPRYTLELSQVGQGTVTKDPDLASYERGTEVQLTACPELGWEFESWEGLPNQADQSLSPTVITMDMNQVVKAIFKIKYYRLDIKIIGDGYVKEVSDQPLEEYYPHGSTLRIKAVANPGSEFLRWSELWIGTEEIVVTFNEDRTLTAVFQELPRYDLNISIVGQGKVTKEPDLEGYYRDTLVTLTAVPNPGWEFKRWGISASGTNNVTEVLIEYHTEVSAVFTELPVYTLTVSATVGGGSAPGNLIEIEPNKPFYYKGESVTIKANSYYNTFYWFKKWSGDYNGAEEEITITMNKDTNLIAIYTIFGQSIGEGERLED